MQSPWHWRETVTCWSLNSTEGGSTAFPPTPKSDGEWRVRLGSIRHGGHGTKKPSLCISWKRTSSSFQKEVMSSDGRQIQANSRKSTSLKVLKGPLSTITVTNGTNLLQPLPARCIGCKGEACTNAFS